MPFGAPIDRLVQAWASMKTPWRAALRAAAAIVAVQAVYWLLIQPQLFRPASSPRLYEVTSAMAANLPAPTTAALADAEFSPIELPWSSCCAPGYRALRFDFTLPQVPETGLGITPIIDADNAVLIVNDHVLRAEGSLDLQHIEYDRIRVWTFVPPSLLRPGQNRMDIILARAALPYFDAQRAPLVGEYAHIREAFAHRKFMLNEYRLIAATMAALIALIALVVALRARQWEEPFWVMALASVAAMQSQYSLWSDPPLTPTLRLFLSFVLSAAAALAWLNLANAWNSARPLRWITLSSLAAFGVCAGVIAFGLWRMDQPQGYDLAGDILHYFVLATSSATVFRFASHLRQHDGARVWELAILALCVSLLTMDALSELSADIAAGNATMLSPLLLLGLMLAFLARNVRLFRSNDDIRAELATRLAAREAELSAAHSRERELVRREAHQIERQRIMRDMHDGVGGRLVSLAAQVRADDALTRTEIADSLMATLDEIRLIIDSLDTAGDDLGMAIGAFRSRMEGRLRAAGLATSWTIADDAARARFTPSEVLEIFRIMQEAASNTLRHARASNLSITLRRVGADLVLSLSDDGVGIATDPGKGRGLDNIATRAARIGASIRMDTSGQGLRLDLVAAGRFS